MSQGANGRSTGVRRLGESGQGEPQPGAERRALSPDDALPPVEPPSASFIIKLFVVPAVIVAVVVGVVLCFQWIAQTEVDVKSHLDAIDRNANNAWQCAHDLAKLLQNDEKLRADAVQAKRLSNITAERIKSGPPKGETKEDVLQEVGLRVFLCKALGEFTTPAALPGLVEAARPVTSQSPGGDEALAAVIQDGGFEVRKAALEGIALLAHHVRKQGEEIATPEVVSLVIEASREVGPSQQRAIRERAAYALGILGGQPASARLFEMLSDIHSNVRFNAATGLARLGNAQGVDVLREMLDPAESTVGDLELDQAIVAGNVSDAEKATLRNQMEATIRLSGLSAVEQLAQANAQADLSRIAEAIESLMADPDTHPAVKRKAQDVSNLLKGRRGQ
jgi:HEAT repeat protein